MIFRLWAAVLAVAALLPASTRADEADSEVKLVVILTRHGVRSPILTNDTLGKFAAQPWPQWSVPPGYLTPHGKQQMVLMGQYYRALYTAQGLLSGKTATDLPRIFFRADSDQRTIETARDLARGLVLDAQPEVHACPPGEIDPLYRAASLPVGRPDRALAVAAVLGRIGSDLAVVPQALKPAFATLKRVLLGESGTVPLGKIAVPDLPAAVQAGTSDHTVDFDGPLHTAAQITDSLMLEYAEGMAPKDVGWGRLTPADLTQLIELHSLYFELTQGTFYPAQVQGSNLASHILKTIDQAASGRADPGAFGSTEQKMIILVGHDTNIINLGGLLGLSWWLSGTQSNPVLPGGALVFELRQRRRDQQFTVRTYYVSQTLEQIRTLSSLTLQNPPAIAPIFIPGCSEAGPGFDAPLARFEALLRRVIDPDFVLPGSS